jgi:hypothetical protein
MSAHDPEAECPVSGGDLISALDPEQTFAPSAFGLVSKVRFQARPQFLHPTRCGRSLSSTEPPHIKGEPLYPSRESWLNARSNRSVRGRTR